jgi:hypothetical protein
MWIGVVRLLKVEAIWIIRVYPKAMGTYFAASFVRGQGHERFVERIKG